MTNRRDTNNHYHSGSVYMELDYQMHFGVISSVGNRVSILSSADGDLIREKESKIRKN